MIVNFGKTKLATLIDSGGSVTDWRTLRFGTTGDATTLTDAALKAPIAGASVTGSLVRTDNKLAFSAQWLNETGAPKTVREFGLFDGAGNLCLRKATGDPDSFTEAVIGAGQALYVDTYDVYVVDASEV